MPHRNRPPSTPGAVFLAATEGEPTYEGRQKIAIQHLASMTDDVAALHAAHTQAAEADARGHAAVLEQVRRIVAGVDAQASDVRALRTGQEHLANALLALTQELRQAEQRRRADAEQSAEREGHLIRELERLHRRMDDETAARAQADSIQDEEITGTQHQVAAVVAPVAALQATQQQQGQTLAQVSKRVGWFSLLFVLGGALVQLAWKVFVR